MLLPCVSFCAYVFESVRCCRVSIGGSIATVLPVADGFTARTSENIFGICAKSHREREHRNGRRRLQVSIRESAILRKLHEIFFYRLKKQKQLLCNWNELHQISFQIMFKLWIFKAIWCPWYPLNFICTFAFLRRQNSIQDNFCIIHDTVLYSLDVTLLYLCIAFSNVAYSIYYAAF